MKSEAHLQQQIVMWFRNEYCIKQKNKGVIFSVPNEGIRSPGLVQRLKGLGMLSGVSDLIVLLPGRVLFVELKYKTGTQSDKQKKFQADVTGLGFEYYVLKCLEDFINCIES